MSQLQFTNDWFEATAKGAWDQFIPKIKPSKILEIGSYEGASACYLIQTLAAVTALEIHCVDTWQGGLEHKSDDMSAVEARFRSNVKAACDAAGNRNRIEVVVHRGPSHHHMPRLLAEGKANYFDFIYIDGSHQAPDVLSDAVFGFRLLRVGGVMAFDDYLWVENLPTGVDPIRSPKLAIDSFTNIYIRKIKFFLAPLSQVYFQKISD
jgi:predicted O-methyltransferase YrrM